MSDVLLRHDGTWVYPFRPSGAEALAQRLSRAVESRRRALRSVQSAADARRDLAFELPEGFKDLEVIDFGGFGGQNFDADIVATLDVRRWHLIPSEQREARLHGLLDTALESLAVSNEALAEMAKKLAQQLVGEPGKLISGSEIAEMLGISEESVRQRHQAGKLIAILSEGRERGRGFPIFQAWDGIAGAPLEQILIALGYEGPGKAVDAAAGFQFFVSRNELLGGFTPVEVLTGAGVPDPDDDEAAEFLAKPHQERVDFVAAVAHTHSQARDE